MAEATAELVRRAPDRRAEPGSAAVRRATDYSRLRLPATAPSDSVRFLAVSRLMPQKGLLASLQAFERVRRELPGCRFDIVGDGPQRALLARAVVERGLSACVTLHGRVPPEEHLRLLRSADVFVQHSLRLQGWLEGFGVSITEASACGVPVVSTRSGGIGDQITDGENGLLVEPGDVDGMARAMLRLARDPELRRRFGAAGRERAAKCFDAHSQALVPRICAQDGRGARALLAASAPRRRTPEPFRELCIAVAQLLAQRALRILAHARLARVDAQRSGRARESLRDAGDPRSRRAGQALQLLAQGGQARPARESAWSRAAAPRLERRGASDRCAQTRAITPPGSRWSSSRNTTRARRA